jgi:DNA-binding PadR family transcriptional regulator
MLAVATAGLPGRDISSILRKKSGGGVVALQLAGLEEWALLAIVALDGEAYGVSIHDKLQRAGMEASLGAIYTSLERLEEKGFVRSGLGDASPSRGGRRKRLFRVTASGKQALAATQEIRGRLWTLEARST